MQCVPLLNVHQCLSLRSSVLYPEHQPLRFPLLLSLMKGEAGNGVLMFSSGGAPSDKSPVTVCSTVPPQGDKQQRRIYQPSSPHACNSALAVAVIYILAYAPSLWLKHSWPKHVHPRGNSEMGLALHKLWLYAVHLTQNPGGRKGWSSRLSLNTSYLLTSP